MMYDKKFISITKLTQATINLLNTGGELDGSLRIHCGSRSVGCSGCLFAIKDTCQYGHYYKEVSDILSNPKFKQSYPEYFI